MTENGKFCWFCCSEWGGKHSRSYRGCIAECVSFLWSALSYSPVWHQLSVISACVVSISKSYFKRSILNTHNNQFVLLISLRFSNVSNYRNYFNFDTKFLEKWYDLSTYFNEQIGGSQCHVFELWWEMRSLKGTIIQFSSHFYTFLRFSLHYFPLFYYFYHLRFTTHSLHLIQEEKIMNNFSKVNVLLWATQWKKACQFFLSVKKVNFNRRWLRAKNFKRTKYTS